MGSQYKDATISIIRLQTGGPPSLSFFLLPGQNLQNSLERGGGQLEGRGDKRQGVVVVEHYRTGGVSKQRQPSKTGLYCM